MTDDLTSLAQAILRVRRDRARDLPAGLFGGEQAWEMLLVLFVADAHGQQLTGARVLDATDCPAPIGQRWLDYLARQQLIAGDGDGLLDAALTLTPAALAALERWLGTARTTLPI